MSLRDLWISSPEQIRDKHVQQIIAFAGEGELLDGGAASAEFRAYLSHVPSSVLSRYTNECLAKSFPNSGLAFQDLVNEVGRRLGFSVTSGRYRGQAGQVGFDGLWRFPDQHAAVVEVKTTDAYRITLETLANYRRSLVAAGTISEGASSILIVVGREDTGDLEAQIRGSRYAWDIRVISMESLLRLLTLKEELENPETVAKIHALLVPHEFTRLDDIVELLFSTASEVKQEEIEPDESEPDLSDRKREPKFIPVAFHEACVARIEIALGTPLVRESRATFRSPDRSLLLVCAVSKEHDRAGFHGYWFALHPYQREMLRSLSNAYVAFGCGSPNDVLLIPAGGFDKWLDGMNVTQRGDHMYWHVKIAREGERLALARPGVARIDLTGYLVTTPAPAG
jgi:hypothetical protein